MSLAIVLHVLSVMIWVGGMFFAYFSLRPSIVEVLDPAQRLILWNVVFKRFFRWVWLAVILVLSTGLWMVFSVYSGFAHLPVYIHSMFGLGILMMLIYAYVFFIPYAKLKNAVSSESWQLGGQALAKIRIAVAINTFLGVCTISLAVAGRFF
ncbi:MAG: CopD family protein [bacterium]